MKRKIIIAVLCLSIIGIGFSSSSVRAMSLTNIRALIQQLQQMVIQLQQQLMAIRGNVPSSTVTSPKLCLASNNLSYGMTNSQVRILQEGLKKDPTVFPPYPGEPAVSTGHFGPRTRAAVIAFQSKYGIRITGQVGSQTRAKFNELYCYNTNYPSTPIGQEFVLKGIITFQKSSSPSSSYKEFYLATCPNLSHPYVIRYGNNTKIFHRDVTGTMHSLSELNTGSFYEIKGVENRKTDSACSNMVIYTATSVEYLNPPALESSRGYCQD